MINYDELKFFCDERLSSLCVHFHTFLPVQVLVGDPHTCSCSVYRKEKDLCIHILW